MNNNILKTILAISRTYWIVIFSILVVGISQTYIGMYTLVLFQRLIDSLAGAQEIGNLTSPLTGYIVFTILNHILIYTEGIPTSILNQGILQWVKLRALEKIERIDYQVYQNLGTGNLIQNVENGAEATRSILTGFYLHLVRSVIPQFVISLVFIREYDQGLALIILGGYGLLYLITFYSMRSLKNLMEAMLVNQEDFSKYSVRAFMELVVFRVNSRFKAEFDRLQGYSDEIVRSKTKIYLMQELFASGFALFIFLIEAMVIIQQVSKILAGSSTIGTLVALVSFIRIVFWPITMFSYSWITYRLDAVTFNRFMEFLSLPEDTQLNSGKMLNLKTGDIRFEKVGFNYQEQAIFKNFTLKIPGGQTTALVGATGSGKSTLVRLLLQLLKPQQGKISLDDQDMREIDLTSYYPALAYIPQEPPIFDGTILENLTFGRQVAPTRLETVINQIELADLISKLPKGLDTLVGERGIKLSGGERQRLAFGRVLLQNPRIVILDEPTSALDSLTEDLITRKIIPFLRGKTVILVAHRLQTVQMADQIVVLEGGQIAQHGQFQQLLQIEGPFKELWQKQAQEAA